MSASSPALLLHVRPLATGQGKLGALLWHGGAQGPSPAWLAQPEVQALSLRLPNLWKTSETSNWPADTRASFEKTGMKCVAEEDLALCNQALAASGNATWVDGDWYMQPPARPSSAQAASRSLAMRLLQLVTSDADTADIEEVFRHDATLSYQLLRLVNSAGIGSGRTINNFAQAILILGRQQLRRWVNLLLFTARNDDPRSALLMVRVTLRARGMELLAHEAGLDRAQQDQAFMAGMFSMLGVLFGQPVEQVLAPLALPEELNAAIIHAQGELGLILRAWQAAENGDTAALAAALGSLGVQGERYNELLPQSCLWTLNLTQGEA